MSKRRVHCRLDKCDRYNKVIALSTNKCTKLGITLPHALITELDKYREDVPRSRFIRTALTRYVAQIGRRKENRGVEP